MKVRIENKEKSFRFLVRKKMSGNSILSFAISCRKFSSRPIIKDSKHKERSYKLNLFYNVPIIGSTRKAMP